MAEVVADEIAEAAGIHDKVVIVATVEIAEAQEIAEVVMAEAEMVEAEMEAIKVKEMQLHHHVRQEATVCHEVIVCQEMAQKNHLHQEIVSLKLKENQVAKNALETHTRKINILGYWC